MKTRLEKFIKHLEDNPVLPLKNQECCGIGKNFWCADWWTIETAKCLLYGENVYRDSNLSSRFNNNRNFSKNNIIGDANRKLKMVEILKNHLNLTDSILVCEVGRGLDILIAEYLKSWETIYCYDSNDIYEEYLTSLWGDKVKFAHLPTSKYDLDIIDGEFIAVHNHARSLDLINKMKGCKKAVCIIKEGVKQ